jgi:hypothetical protein
LLLDMPRAMRVSSLALKDFVIRKRLPAAGVPAARAGPRPIRATAE